MKTATGRESTSTDRLVRQMGHFTILALWILSGVSPSPVAAEPADGRPLDVRTFGARGDGVADDTAAVHAGIAAAANSGRTLLIPKGTYLVGKPIRVTAHGLKIVGAGAQHTVLKASAEMDRLLYLRGTGMVISRLTLDANKKATYGIHAFHLNEQDSRLEFLRVHGARSHGIFLDHSQVFEIANCIAQGNGGDGFYITDCNGTRISVCRSMANRGRGFCVTHTDLSGGCWLLDC
ncbi:MAG: glycosyl hydrolase family 28-related protein, partial [Planctomycetota bacterium]|nr:glycosyl hydrolase family 28-related protein [Planctomycetota bacterium]